MWHDPDDRLQKAIDRYDEGDVDAARAMLRSLERQGVISPRIDLYLGHCHLDDDRPRAALRRYQRCVSIAPSDASPWIGIALCHGRFGRLDRALELLERAAVLDPLREETHCHLVHCHALVGQLAEAEKHARLAMDLDPGCPHVHRHLAVAQLVAGRPDRALDSWRDVLEREPTHPEADLGIARCHVALGRRSEARRHYHRALRGDYAADAHAGLGDLAWMEGRLEDAVVQYRNAVLQESHHDEARLRLVEVLTDLGRLPEAWTYLQPLEEAWAPVPDPRTYLEEGGMHDPEVVFAAARVQRAMGRRAEGLRLLRHLVERHPDVSATWDHLGRYLLLCGHATPAVGALRRAFRLAGREPDGDTVGPVRRLARALARRGRRREAVSVLASAAFREPGAAELHLDVTAALLARGRVAAAERALVRGLELLPGHPDLWAAAAELSLELGATRVARQRIGQALRADPRHGQALALLVRWLLDEGAYARAVNAARAAERVLPVDHAVVRDHGRALLLCGRAGEAVLPLRRYVLAVPSDPEGYRLLARALEATGDAAGARSQRRLEAVVCSPV